MRYTTPESDCRPTPRLRHALDALGQWIRIIAPFLLLAAGVAFFVRGCEGDVDHARGVVESSGYTNVIVGGPSRWSCSDSDTVSNTFTAVSANGKKVSGIVCCGLIFKNCTVRFK